MDEKDKKEAFSFIRETIKERPLKKKRILLWWGIAIVFGCTFGLCAAIVYTVGIHSLSDVMYPEEVEKVSFSGSEDAVPEETVSENHIEVSANEAEEQPSVINNIVEKVSLGIEDYEGLYLELNQIAQNAKKSILTVTAVGSDTDWFSDTYENSNMGLGLVIADNKKELLILVDGGLIKNEKDKVMVTLPDGEQLEAVRKKKDSCTNLAVIGIPKKSIPNVTLNKIQIADLGVSTGNILTGRPVIAIGSVQSASSIVRYGMVTSAAVQLELPDIYIHLLTTDIYSSSENSGILVNLHGEVVGIICHEEIDSADTQLINAYSISDLKSIIERMSNGQDKAYLGIKGIDVTEEANSKLNIPMGAFVKEVILDSPAMECGIQSGDIITMIGTTEITCFNDYKQAIEKASSGDETVVTVMRRVREEYSEVSYDVVLGKLE